MRNEIPRWFWMNGQLNFELSKALETDPTQSISHFIQEFEKSRGLRPGFNIKNQGMMISLLYGLLVVPKEIWESGNVETAYQFKTKSLFTINTGTFNQVSDFLRLMRNSVSHANYEITLDPSGYKF